MLNKFIILICTVLLTACTTSPTGRSRITLMPDAQIKQMGLQAFNDLKTKKKQDNNIRHKQFVNCIADAITHETGGSWEVVIFADKSLNAFALPGNKIGVHTGLINLVDNADQLAAVIGHEVGHVLAKHSNERMSQKTALSIIQKGAALLSPTTAAGKLALGALGIGGQYGLILPFSRAHESEADIMGLDFMAKAGFDPRESITLWQKMDQASQGAQPAEIMSTHPSHGTRINELSAHMPVALKYYQQAQSIGKKPRCHK